uniref:Uncharacterized protein n=1 Tax=Colensoa physaloides TaxID=268274 RepID=A0A291F259_9ASTR|nr:hypothetical protein Co_phy1Pt0019 [Colensoa physaloides]ATG26181.1 hypothetical protein Co_phy1Pt0019 [Colensoa physaloides]
MILHMTNCSRFFEFGGLIRPQSFVVKSTNGNNGLPLGEHSYEYYGYNPLLLESEDSVFDLSNPELPVGEYEEFDIYEEFKMQNPDEFYRARGSLYLPFCRLDRLHCPVVSKNAAPNCIRVTWVKNLTDVCKFLKNVYLNKMFCLGEPDGLEWADRTIAALNKTPAAWKKAEALILSQTSDLSKKINELYPPSYTKTTEPSQTGERKDFPSCIYECFKLKPAVFESLGNLARYYGFWIAAQNRFIERQSEFFKENDKND